MSFKKDFIWGTATASFQIEGAADEDGKGKSVWDMFCRKPGAVYNGYNGYVACDHYHRYAEDVGIMKEIGLKAYRLSISWPRVIPAGKGEINPRGMDFYDRLFDLLLENGVEPFVTLFHWDYPYELYCRGGWLNPDSPEWFAEYTEKVVSRFSDRVKNWMTFNEPNCFIGLGHLEGRHAPGDKLGFKETLRAAHNVLLSHGKSVQAIRSHTKKPCKIGFAPLGKICIPATEKKQDIDAARSETFAIRKKNFWHNTWWMDPVYLGQYPEDGLDFFGSDLPEVGPDDMAVICQPLDFLAFNHYSGSFVQAGKDGNPEILPFPEGAKKTAFFDNADYWSVTPESLYWGPKFFQERYKLPVIITENGMSNVDWVSLDGKVHDPQRIDYLNRYLLELRKATDEGVKIDGYFLWSLMDNFEWAEAYRQRFGIVYSDYQTQKRTFKDSAYWYREVIRTNGASL